MTLSNRTIIIESTNLKRLKIQQLGIVSIMSDSDEFGGYLITSKLDLKTENKYVQHMFC